MIYKCFGFGKVYNSKSIPKTLNMMPLENLVERARLNFNRVTVGVTAVAVLATVVLGGCAYTHKPTPTMHISTLFTTDCDSNLLGAAEGLLVRNYDDSFDYYKKAKRCGAQFSNEELFPVGTSLYHLEKGLLLHFSDEFFFTIQQDQFFHASRSLEKIEYILRHAEPQSTDGYAVCMRLGEVYMRTEQYDKALDYYLSAMRADFTPEVVAKLKEVNRIRSESHQRFGVYFDEARALMEQGEYQTAIDLLEPIMEEECGTYEGWVLLTQCSLSLGDPKGAFYHYIWASAVALGNGLQLQKEKELHSLNDEIYDLRANPQKER